MLNSTNIFRKYRACVGSSPGSRAPLKDTVGKGSSVPRLNFHHSCKYGNKHFPGKMPLLGRECLMGIFSQIGGFSMDKSLVSNMGPMRKPGHTYDLEGK